MDKLKIDQSFTGALGKDQEIRGIVRSIIELGRAMHMLVTAEGVETAEQQDILAAMGCDQLQGYLLSKPVAVDSLIESWPATPHRHQRKTGSLRPARPPSACSSSQH